METIDGSTAVNPYRAGKPLHEPFDGYRSARRGTYRIIYRTDEAKRQIEIQLNPPSGRCLPRLNFWATARRRILKNPSAGSRHLRTISPLMLTVHPATAFHAH